MGRLGHFFAYFMKNSGYRVDFLFFTKTDRVKIFSKKYPFIRHLVARIVKFEPISKSEINGNTLQTFRKLNKDTLDCSWNVTGWPVTKKYGGDKVACLEKFDFISVHTFFFTSFTKQNYKQVKNSKAQVSTVFFKNLNFSWKLEGNFCSKKCDFA